MTRSKNSKWLPRKKFKEDQLKQRMSTPNLIQNYNMLVLSPDVLWLIFGEWIRITDLTALDTAYCNSKYRPMFLQLLAANEFYVQSKVESNKCPSKWLLTRYIGCTYIQLDTQLIENGWGSALVSIVQQYCAVKLNWVSSMKLKSIVGERWNSILITILTNSPNLQRLSLVKCIINSNEECNSNLSKLDYLKFTDCYYILNNFPLTALTGPKLRSLTLDRLFIMKEVTSNGNKVLISDRDKLSSCVSDLLTTCGPSITSINTSAISSEVLSVIALACTTSLLTLNISGSSANINDGIFNLSMNCPNLTSVAFPGCSKVSEDSIIALAQGCPNVNRCLLDGCREISDFTVTTISQRWKHLQYFSVRYCTNVTDDSLESIKNNCYDTLMELYLDKCSVTDEGVLSLLNLPQLTKITVKGCKRVSDLCLIAIALRDCNY